jgi:hypothetical protein
VGLKCRKGKQSLFIEKNHKWRGWLLFLALRCGLLPFPSLFHCSLARPSSRLLLFLSPPLTACFLASLSNYSTLQHFTPTHNPSSPITSPPVKASENRRSTASVPLPPPPFPSLYPPHSPWHPQSAPPPPAAQWGPLPRSCLA